MYFDGWIEGGNVAIRPFGQGSLVGELGEALGLTNAWTGEVDAAYGLGQTDIEGMTAVGDATLFHTGTEDPESEIVDASWRRTRSGSRCRPSRRAASTRSRAGSGPSAALARRQQVLDAYVDVLTA